MLKKYTQTDRYGNMMSQEMDGKFLKKRILKDRHGNKMSFEFDIPESNVPPVSTIPQYSARGGDASEHPGGPKGTDTVPAWLTPGEFVVNKEATDIFGDVIEKMNNVGRKIQKQNGSAPDKMTDVKYAEEGQMILTPSQLEEIPEFRAQLEKMLDKFRGTQFTRDNLYRIIAGESGFDPTARNEDTGAAGFFQFTDKALEDLNQPHNKKRFGYKEDLTKEAIRNMSPTEQLKLYDDYLTKWNYDKKPDVHLGIMQGAPGEAANFKNMNEVVYKKGSPEWEQNPGWRPDDQGDITFADMARYYDRKDPIELSPEEASRIASLKIPNVTVETADQIPPLDIVPVSATSGAQEFPEVRLTNLPIDTALNVNSAPTDNFSVNIPNYSGSVPVESDMEITNPSQGVVTNPRIGYESFDDLLRTKPMYALDMDADGRPDVSTIGMEEQLYGSPKIVMPPIEGTNVETKTLSEKIADGMPTINEEVSNMMNQTQSSNAIQHDTRAPTLSIPKYGNLISPPPFTEDYEGVPALEQIKKLGSEILNKGFEGENTISNLYTAPDAEEADLKEKEENKKMAEEEAKYKEAFKDGRGNKNLDEAIEKEKKLAEIAKQTEKNPELDEEDPNKVEEKGDGSSNEEQNKAINFFEDIFGSLFNKNELKRMAIMYVGSRLLGYNHHNSLNYAVKNYVSRVDTLEASRIKFSQSDEAKNYDPKSVAEYVRTGDFSKLIRIGQPYYRQGQYETWYDKATGKKVVVEKAHKGSGDTKQVVWLGPNGKELRKGDFDDTGIYSKGSKDRQEVIAKFNDDFAKIIEEERVSMRNQMGDSLDAYDGLNTLEASAEVLDFMLNKKADVLQIQRIIPMAYREAINNAVNSGKKEKISVESLLPVLNSLMYQQYTGQPDLFKTQPDKKHEKDWDGVAGTRDHMDMVKFNKAIDAAAFIVMSEFPGMNKDEAAALYIDDLAELWNGVRMEGNDLDPENLSKADRKRYWGRAYATGTSGFYEFLQEKIAAEINDALKKNK